MSRIGSNFTRTTSLMQSNNFLSALRRTQNGLAQAENAISSGKIVNRPSDAPSSASALLLLQRTLERREQHERNLGFASSLLNNVDAALGDMSNLVLEAKTIGSSQIGLGSNSDTRKNQATVIDAQIQTLLDMSNRTHQGVSLFGGSLSPGQQGQPVFMEYLGGIRYTGATTALRAEVGLDQPLAINSNGQDALAALSSRVKGIADLDPQATATTLLSNVRGAQGLGVRLGTIRLEVDGAATTVDLTTAQTLGDIATRINAAVAAIDPTAGGVALSGGGFELTANLGHTLTISDLGASQVAADLGLDVSATDATVAGGDLDPQLTALTTLASLASPIDWASGLKITQGGTTKVADFSAAVTIQDAINVIEQLGLGIQLEINAAGSGLNLLSQVSGIDLSVGEVSGGTTARDLGVRTFDTTTALKDLNHGLGVQTHTGQDDFAVTLHDGTIFNVNLDGVTTVQGVIDAINTAATTAMGAGNVGVPGQGGTLFNVGLAADGNGLTLEDQTVGATNFGVTNLNLSHAATDLGLQKDVASGGVIIGDDVAQVRVESVFSHLMALRDALLADDSRGITLATSSLETDTENLARAHADVGVRANRVEAQLDRSEELKITEKSMLSQLQDTDLATMITRYSLLQQQLQASLQVGAQNMQLSLLDFLR